MGKAWLTNCMTLQKNKRNPYFQDEMGLVYQRRHTI